MATHFSAEDAIHTRIALDGARVPVQVAVPDYECGVSYSYPTMDRLADLGVPREGIMDLESLIRACQGGVGAACQDLLRYARAALSRGGTHVRIS